MQYEEMLSQIKSLTKEAEKLKQAERQQAIKNIKNSIRLFEITKAELFSEQRGDVKAGRGAKKSSAKRAKSKAAGSRAVVADKYRDAHGNKWSGRGKMPRWLAGQVAQGRSLSDFAISQDTRIA